MTLVILLHAGAATAYTISIEEVSCGSGPSCSYLPSDILEIDVVLDSEGETFYGFGFSVWFDPAVLPVTDITHHPIPEEDYGGIDTDGLDYWYIYSVSFNPIGPAMQPIATLVFQVMDVPSSTVTAIIPSFDAGTYYDGFFMDQEFTNVSGEVVLNDLVVHVPEPMSPLLLASGVGLLILLHRLRQRKLAV